MTKPIRGSGNFPDHIMISIYDNPATTMAITWRCDVKITDGFVLYREDGTERQERIESTHHTFKSDIDESNIFGVRLKNLKPGTKYFYTCGNQDYRSKEYSFCTAPEKIDKFKFICFSDQQKGDPFEKPDYSGFNKFVKDVLRENPDTAFILTGGDNTDCGQHEQQWNGALLGFEGIMESVPLQMSVGNHDNRGFEDYRLGIGRYYAEPAEYFNTQFKYAYADNGPGIWKTENYTFDYGNAHFSVIGINGPEEVNDWLVSDLSANKQDWKLGVYHFPVCYSGVDCQNYDCIPAISEGMEKLDLLFSGHEHNFSRSFPRHGEELFEKPSMGTVHYMLGNSNQNPPGSKTMSKVWHAAYYAQEARNRCVCIVEIEDRKMTLTSLLDDGRIVDKCVIDKDKDEITPYAIAPFFGENRTKMFFKGMDLGLAAADIHPFNENGVWYLPIGLLISFIGGEVVREKGKIRLSVYDHTAEFTENSRTVIADTGEITLDYPCIRGSCGQLYVPADAVSVFEMRWAYSERNNFISVEHESEDHPYCIQN